MTTTTVPNRPPFLLRLLIKAQNPFMKWLLRSSRHTAVSDKYMLITLTGRKSGKVYTIPVQYAQDKQELYIVTSASYTWWRNLRGGAPVQVHVRGVTYAGIADTSTDPQTISATMGHIYPGLSTNKRAAPGKVAITVTLHPDEETSR